MKFEDKAKENNEMNISKDSKIFLELREIVNRFDPVSLVKNGASDNEHDDLTKVLLELLFKESIDEIRDLLIVRDGTDMIRMILKKNIKKDIRQRLIEHIKIF